MIRDRAGPVGSVTRLAGVVVLVLCLVPAPALAYLDPRASSMLVQLLLGGAAGLLVVVKAYWSKIKSFLASRVFGRRPRP